MRKWICCADRLPNNIPEDKDFGVEYEVVFIDENFQPRVEVLEWLWERKWNCKYPVIAWRELKSGEPICDYTKTDWNDCCECAAKDYCDKYNERSEIINELLGEIKNEGR